MNPVERLQQEAAETRRVERLKNEALNQAYIDEIKPHLESLPELIKSRDFIDCGLMNWEGGDYASFNLAYIDNDYRSNGLSVRLLFNESLEYIYVAQASERFGVFTGGIVLDEETLETFLARAPQSQISSTLGKITLLSSLPADKTLHDVYQYDLEDRVEAAADRLTKARRERVQATLSDLGVE